MVGYGQQQQKRNKTRLEFDKNIIKQEKQYKAVLLFLFEIVN